MRLRATLTASLLGAVNGLLAGAAAHIALVFYVEYENQRSFADGVNIHGIVPVGWWALPSIGGVAFSVGNSLVHTYIAAEAKSILRRWQYVGAVSVVNGYILMLSLTALDSMLGVYPPFDYHNWISSEAAKAFLTALGFTATFNLLYGAFIHLVLAHHNHSALCLTKEGRSGCE